MTSDKNYLGEGNVDKFDALFFKLRQFAPDDQGKNFSTYTLETMYIRSDTMKRK